MIDILHRNYNKLVLKLSTEETDPMQLGDDKQDPKYITVGPAQFKIVTSFRYLRSHLSKDWSLVKESDLQHWVNCCPFWLTTGKSFQ